MLGTMFRDLGGFRQVGMIVSDLDATMNAMVRMGIGPFLVLRDLPMDHYKLRGVATPSPVLSVGLAQAGPMQIEVIQQVNDTPSLYREFLASGREGVQHLAVWLDDPDQYLRSCDRLQSAGYRLVQESGSTAFIRSAYFETDVPGGLMVEVSEQRIPVARSFSENLAKAAAEWDGSDPIRPFKSMAPKSPG